MSLPVVLHDTVFEYGKLRVHSHAWSKNLAAIGNAGNVLDLAVVDR